MPEITDTRPRLRRALAACELRARDWSSSSDLMFAIYEPGDGFLGCVRIAGDAMTVHESPATRIDRRCRAELERLITAWRKG